ncbi:hypothetical protein O181_015671 [Austropuccinia psidii MF-1]|uniref:ribonuclease Z n=1 Tax=Austropuccinia psidii MF-1 TaxID=1389203 RepID=A0A9Q3C469_9BASI|nr:hypothetical protein [Austropuccinia psidii MF-1]
MPANAGPLTRPSVGANSPISIRPILVHSSDSSCPTLLLSFDKSRYLFNCPENTSRAFVQSRITQRNLCNVFLSSPRAAYAGGTYGMLMTLADSKMEKIRLIGPAGLKYMMACGRLFTRRQGMAVEVVEFQTDSLLQPVFHDEFIWVYAIGGKANDEVLMGSKRPSDNDNDQVMASKRARLLAENSGASQTDCVTSCKIPDKLQEIIDDMFRSEDLPREPSTNKFRPAYSYERLRAPKSQLNADPVSYLVVGPRLRGKFLPEKAKALGVKPGPDFAKLVNGQSIEVDGGRLVSGDMCIEGGSPGSAFLISNVASLEQLSQKALLDPERFNSACDGAKLVVVYHFVHEAVLLDERYIRWISKFGPSVKHYVSTPAHCPDLFTFKPSAVLQLKLNMVSPSLFSLPHYSLEPKLSCKSESLNMLKRSEVFCINPTHPMEPNKSTLDYKLFDGSIEKDELISRLHLKSEFAQLLDEVRNTVSMDSQHVNGTSTSGNEIIATTLGTASAAPSKYRNVSSTLLHLPHAQGTGLDFILLDAGEGTLGQIKRKFGPQWTTILKNLKLIFISHLHADHHCGLMSILAERSKLSECNPVALVCQYGMFLHLTERLVIEQLGSWSSRLFQWFNSEDLVRTSAARPQKIIRLQELLSCGLEVETVPVAHWGKCYGICIQHKHQNQKIVFSGDTKPCNSLVDAGQGADLLIHEATLGAEEIELAEIKGHSTIDQAIETALRMKAKNCLLNHFSGRYPKLPPSFNKVRDHQTNVGVSFDLMSCTISQVAELQNLLPALEYVVKTQENFDAQEEADEPVMSATAPKKQTKANKSTNGRKLCGNRQRLPNGGAA